MRVACQTHAVKVHQRHDRSNRHQAIQGVAAQAAGGSRQVGRRVGRFVGSLLTEESAGWNTMKLPREGARSSKGPLFMRLLRLLAAILLSQSVVTAPDHSVFAAKDLSAASRNRILNCPQMGGQHVMRGKDWRRYGKGP